VLEPGVFAAGDSVTVESVPRHAVTVRMLFEGRDAAAMQTLLDEPGLAPKVYRDAAAALKSSRRP
jgi:hypothetical protein